MDLKEKVAIVTGAGGGIGRGIALQFGSLGARVVVADVKAEGAKETLSRLEKSGVKGLALGTDITDRAQVQEMVKATLDIFGKLDILVNNAGWDSNCHQSQGAYLLHPGGPGSYDGAKIRENCQHQLRCRKGGKLRGGSLFGLQRRDHCFYQDDRPGDGPLPD
jgi:hypothetical protein